MPLIIAGMTFAVIALLTWVAFRPREDVVARRITSGWTTASIQERRLDGGAGTRWIGPLFRRSGTLIARLLPHNIVRHIDRMLLGMPTAVVYRREARLLKEQRARLGQQVLLTYATSVNSTTQQLISAQVNLTPTFSVTAVRDEADVFSLVFKVHRRYR